MLQQLCIEVPLQCIWDQMWAINFDKERVALRQHPGAATLNAQLQRRQHHGDTSASKLATREAILVEKDRNNRITE
jgi:hypothetical protein